MPKKLTLFSFSKKKPERVFDPDKWMIRFLKQLKHGRVLMIGYGPEAIYASKKGFNVTVVDDDLRRIKKARQKHTGIRFEYSSFFNFSRRIRKDEFDIVLDNKYSHRLRRSQLSRFYKEIARMLRFNGRLFTKTYSTQDSYCREHCPKRHWTMINEHYMNFFDKRLILVSLRKSGLYVNTYNLRNYPDKHTYHVVTSTLKTMKL